MENRKAKIVLIVGYTKIANLIKFGDLKLRTQIHLHRADINNKKEDRVQFGSTGGEMFP
jgi:hypothetical protein